MPTALNLTLGITGFAAQSSSWDQSMYAQSSPGLPIGALIVGFLVGIGLQFLFGWWGKSRAEDHGVEPLYGFLAGFFLGWIGVLIVPMLKTNRSLHTRAYQRPVLPYPPQDAIPHYPYTDQPAAPYAPPAPPPLLNQPAYPTAQPAPVPILDHSGPPLLVPDEYGYATCPGCGGRVKTGRRTCTACGARLRFV
jgi:hypothetical protein